MPEINVDYINPFLMAATRVFEDVCQVKTTVGKPFIKKNPYSEEEAVILIGVTGELRGQVQIAFSLDVAKDIASKMCMMQMDKLNEIAQSAVSELGNMIMGNAATLFSSKGIVIDITPPTLCIGKMEISSSYSHTVCVPLNYNGNQIEINICVK